MNEIKDSKWIKETIERERSVNPNTFIFFQHEWNERSEQILSHVNSYNQEQKRVYARKCTVKKIESKQHRDFCDLYHIQGSNKLTLVAFGIFLNGELLGVLSLGRHNRDSKVTVLDRLCFKSGFRIVGGASKLCKRCRADKYRKSYQKNLNHSE